MEVPVCYSCMPSNGSLLTGNKLTHFPLALYLLSQHYLVPCKLLTLFDIFYHKNHHHHLLNKSLYLYLFYRTERRRALNLERCRLNHPKRYHVSIARMHKVVHCIHNPLDIILLLEDHRYRNFQQALADPFL